VTTDATPITDTLQGFAGFIPGSRGSLMMDVVATAMLVVVPGLLFGITQARRRHYVAHKRVQVALAVALAVTVIAFELEVRLVGWRHLAMPSPYYDTWLFPLLTLHVTFAVTTTVMWCVTVVHALRRIGTPPAPGIGSARHRYLGKATALVTLVTATTGWIFYWMAFIA
jgi:putative membrane protein